MRKKSISRVMCTVLLAGTMALGLTACGSKEAQGGEAVDAAENMSTDTEGTVAESAGEVFSEPAETVETAYFEENGLTFTGEREFTLPFAAGTYDPDALEYKEYKGVTVAPASDATLKLGGITPADCDKEGYKAFIVDYSVEGMVRVTVDTYDYDEDYYYEPQFPHVDLTDYYTGKLLPYYPSLERTGEGYDYIERLSFGNKTNEVAYYNLVSFGSTEESGWQIDENADDSRYEYYDIHIIENHVMEIRIPENYDGLVLAIDLSGIAEYDTSEFREFQSTERRLILDSDSTGYAYKPDNAAFIRITDL